MNRPNAAGVEDYESAAALDKQRRYKEELPFWLRVGPITWAFSDREMPNKRMFDLYREGYLAGYQDARSELQGQN